MQRGITHSWKTCVASKQLCSRSFWLKVVLMARLSGTLDNDAFPSQQCRKAPAYVPPHRRAGQQPLQEGDIQIFVELPTRLKRTIILFVKHSTSVKEVKKMVETKSDGILPASRMRLSYKGGNHLSCDELPIKVSQGDTLVCSPTWRKWSTKNAFTFWEDYTEDLNDSFFAMVPKCLLVSNFCSSWWFQINFHTRVWRQLWIKHKGW